MTPDTPHSHVFFELSGVSVIMHNMRPIYADHLTPYWGCLWESLRKVGFTIGVGGKYTLNFHYWCWNFCWKILVVIFLIKNVNNNWFGVFNNSSLLKILNSSIKHKPDFKCNLWNFFWYFIFKCINKIFIIIFIFIYLWNLLFWF